MDETTRIPLAQYQLSSDVLANTRTVWLQPPALESSAPPGLTIFLDGPYFLGHFDAPATVWQLQRDGALPPMWSAYVSAGDREMRWPESMCHPDFPTFLCDELLPQLEATTHASAERLLAGVSLTGLSAAHAALARPGVFDKVLCLSGSFWWEDAALARRVPEFAASTTSFWLTVGDEETATDVDHGHGLIQVLSQVDGVRRMRDALLEHGVGAEYVEFSGGHHASSWRRALYGDLQGLWAM